MTTLMVEIQESKAQTVVVTEEAISVDLIDGRTITVPIAWYPRLQNGNTKERKRWRLIGGGTGIHWAGLDEDISIDNIILGKASGESQASFKRWLETRQKQKKSRG